MKWEMEMTAVEAVLERIWDLHDRISDAIHAISRSHFLRSVKNSRPSKHQEAAAGGVGDDGRSGFVFIKGFTPEEDDSALAEVRSLNAIRTALENLEDHLEFFHSVQSQQRAERDSAIARLEQSRIILAMRLADHQGKKYTVIEEALAFVGAVHDTGRFVSPENISAIPGSHSGGNLEGQEENRLNFLAQMFTSSVELAKRSLKLESVGGLLGNAALFAVSMLALLQLRQVAFRSETLQLQQNFYDKGNERDASQAVPSSENIQMKHIDVFSARG